MSQAEAVNKGMVKPMGTVDRVKAREDVKMLRNPAQMNAMTYAKETGGKRLV